MAEKVFKEIEVIEEEKTYGGFFFKMLMFLALIFVRNVFETANINNLNKVKELEMELEDLKRRLSTTKK